MITNNHLNVLMENGRPNPDVWAIGDAATVEDARLPATAQGEFFAMIVCFLRFDPCLVANQKAKYIVKKINKLAKDQETTQPFEFHNAGSLAYIGNWYVRSTFV